MHSARCSGKGLHRFPCILLSDAFQLLAEGSGAVLSVQTCKCPREGPLPNLSVKQLIALRFANE